jgi:hypothetical protein
MGLIGSTNHRPTRNCRQSAVRRNGDLHLGIRFGSNPSSSGWDWNPLSDRVVDRKFDPWLPQMMFQSKTKSPDLFELSEVQRKAANSRKPEPQQLGTLLVHVLARLGVTIGEPAINSEMLEAPVDESQRE